MMGATTYRDVSPADAGAHRLAGAADAAGIGTPSAGLEVSAALREDLAAGLRASYRHLATLHLAAGSHARAAAMLLAAEKLGGSA